MRFGRRITYDNWAMAKQIASLWQRATCPD
jgi:hypothetical protein